MTYHIRPARSDDVAALAALKLETFRETFIAGFAIPYPPADLAAFETASYGEAAIAAELRDDTRATWIGEDDAGMAGYAQVGPCKLPHADVREGEGELYQLYVRRAAQGSGLGRLLLAQALGHLAAARPGPVWLGVWSGNEKARRVYAARGFAVVGEYRFPVGTWHDDEIIMRQDTPAA